VKYTVSSSQNKIAVQYLSLQSRLTGHKLLQQANAYLEINIHP